MLTVWSEVRSEGVRVGPEREPESTGRRVAATVVGGTSQALGKR